MDRKKFLLSASLLSTGLLLGINSPGKSLTDLKKNSMNKPLLPIMLGNGIPIIYRTLSVEVSLQKAVSSFTLPDNQILRTEGARIYGVEVFTADQATVSPGGLPVIPANAAPGLIITLQDTKNVNRINQIPYFTFIASVNTGYQRMFYPFEINLTTSQVITTDVTNVTTGQVALFNFLYFTPKDVEEYYANMKASEGGHK